MYALFMTLVVLKHNTSWFPNARSFSDKASAIMRLIAELTNQIFDARIQHIVTHVSEKSTRYALSEQKKFNSFPVALETIDVTFQEDNRT